MRRQGGPAISAVIVLNERTTRPWSLAMISTRPARMTPTHE